MEFLRPAHFLEVLSSNCTWHKNWWFGKYLQSTTFTRVNYTQSKASLYLQPFRKARSVFCKKQFTTLESESRQRTGRTGTGFFLSSYYRIHLHGCYGCLQFTGHVGHVIVWAVSLTLWIAGSHPFVHSHSCFQNTKVGKHLLTKAILNAQDA